MIFCVFVQKRQEPFEEKQAQKWFSQMSHAMHYVHSKGISHRDIKLANMLFTEPDLAVADAKVTDFGLARLSYDEERGYLRSVSFAGTEYYMAPEMFRFFYGKLEHFDPFATDVWAMGVSLSPTSIPVPGLNHVLVPFLPGCAVYNAGWYLSI